MRGRSKSLPVWLSGLVFFLALGMLYAQDSGAGNTERSRGSIPEVLLRPQRGEAPRYPVDTAIGPLGQGEAPREGYLFARQVAAALTAGNMNASSLFGMNRAILEGYLSKLGEISPRAYRLGSGREEADGAVSFLIRFVGREQGITGELYVRLTDQSVARTVRPAETAPPETAEETPKEETESPPPVIEQTTRRIWVFEELILDEPRSREEENGDKRRFDFSPYERFF